MKNTNQIIKTIILILIVFVCSSGCITSKMDMSASNLVPDLRVPEKIKINVLNENIGARGHLRWKLDVYLDPKRRDIAKQTSKL